MHEGLIDPVILFSTLFIISFETKEACEEFNKLQRYGEDTEWKSGNNWAETH